MVGSQHPQAWPVHEAREKGDGVSAAMSEIRAGPLVRVDGETLEYSILAFPTISCETKVA